MKNKRLLKLLSFVIAMVMLFSIMPLCSQATETPKILGSDVEGSAGDTVDVTISLKDNPGIISMTLTVIYDSTKLTLTSVNDSGLLTGSTHKPELKTPYTLVWANDAAPGNITVEGVIVTLSFRISDSAVIGNKYNIAISYDSNNWDIYNYDSEKVEFGIDNSIVTVVCPHNNTTNVSEDPADCDEGGYTAGVWCNDCETYTSGHEPTPATGIHTDANGKWESDEVNHFRTCSCNRVFDSARHSGVATCKEKAVCSICKAEYGSVNVSNHVGKKITVGAYAPDHKKQQKGYTGDTKCLDCGKIIAYGKAIAPDAHISSSGWDSDGIHHWKVCGVNGCNVAIDSTKAKHTTVKAENKATCSNKAVCDVCGVVYGDYVSHFYQDGKCIYCSKDDPDYVKMGDTDKNGKITASDARLALRVSVGLEKFSEDLLKIADVNKDMKVTAADARLILRASVGLENPDAWK